MKALVHFPLLNVRRALAILSAASALGCAAQTAPSVTPTPTPTPVPVTGRHVWHVSYEDREMGTVEGTAVVDWKSQEAQVTLFSPIDGTSTVLRAIKVTPPDASGQAEFVLAGASPNMGPVLAPSTDGMVNANGQIGADATAKRSGPEVKAKLAQRDFADDTVTVTLTVSPDNAELEGQWHYRADPLTQRARDGLGRVGAFTMPEEDTASFLGMQTGTELWTALAPAIRYAVVLEDQGSQGPFGATYRYPGPIVAAERGTGGLVNPYLRRREVMIVGENLPVIATAGGHSRSLEPVKTDRTDLTYGSPALIPPTAIGQEPDDAVERGWKTITAGMDARTALSVRGMQAATLTVDFAQGVIPGVTPFTWGGAKGVWQLQFGDNTARVRVVRALSEATYEETPVGFLPEQLFVEVESALSLPVDAIKVYVSAGGKLSPDPLVASRVGSTRVYRTTPFVLQGEGPSPQGLQGLVIPAKLGDTVTFIAEQKRGLFFGAAQASVSVYNDPSELATTWHKRLADCAKLDGKPLPGDWGTATNQQVDTLSSYFVFATKEHSITTNITLGQHAAMLMLRDLFLELMKRQLATLQESARTENGVLGFGKVVAQSIGRNPTSLFAGLPAGTLNGSPVTLADAINDPALEKAFGTNIDGLRAWKVGAFQKGLLSYADSVQKSIDQAAALDPGGMKELLKLTGVKFDPVVAQLLPRMVRWDKEANAWVADKVARGNIQSIAGLEAQFEDQKAAASIDTQLTVGVLSAAATAPMMLSESAVASLLTWAANGLLWEVPAIVEGVELHTVKSDVEFAVGASAVLGHARYDEVKLLDTPWWKFAAGQLVQGVATNLQAIDTLSKFGREMAVFRGARIMEVLDGGVAAIRNLPKSQLGDVEAAVIEAKALKEAGKDLEPFQQSALETWDNYMQEVKAGEAQAAQALYESTAQASQEWLRTQHMRMGFPAEFLDPLIPKVAGEAGDTQAQLFAAAALQRRNNLTEAARQLRAEATKLASAKGSVLEEARGAIADQIADNRSRATAVEAMLADSRKDIALLHRLTDPEVAWLTGVQREVDQAKVKAILEANHASWSEVKDAFKAGTLSPADMHQFITWRKQQVDPMVDAVMAEVEKEMEAAVGYPVKLKRKAFGSTNLTSDYDISVEGPGAERVVAKFNERFRAQYGLESAYVFDTNIYTDPAYKLFKARALDSGSLALGTVEMDTVRQFVYEQTATRKYATDEVWKAHMALLKAKAPPETQAMLDFAFKQAEATNTECKAIIKGLQGAETGSNAEYKALNLAYADVLGEIDQWRLEMERLDNVLRPTSHLIEPPPAAFLEKFPKYKAKAAELQKLLNEGELKNAAEFRTAMQQEVMAQIRDSQGKALYFASEAYQSEGTIIHVVDELQGGGGVKRATNLKALMGPPVKTPLDTLSYISSFNENRANLFKELGHMGYFGGHGKVAAGRSLAAKGSKYFIRQLDAMKQAGIDLKSKIDVSLIALTAEIDSVRGNEKTVEAVLKDYGITGEDYIKKMLEASDSLAVAGTEDKQFKDLAKYLQNDFADLNRMQGLSTVK